MLKQARLHHSDSTITAGRQSGPETRQSPPNRVRIGGLAWQEGLESAKQEGQKGSDFGSLTIQCPREPAARMRLALPGTPGRFRPACVSGCAARPARLVHGAVPSTARGVCCRCRTCRKNNVVVVLGQPIAAEVHPPRAGTGGRRSFQVCEGRGDPPREICAKEAALGVGVGIG